MPETNDEKARLKVARRNQKGQLTRTLGTLSTLLKGDDAEIVRTYISRAEQQFQKLEEKHQALIELVVEDQEYEEEEQWMVESEKEYIMAMVNAKKFVQPPTAAQPTTSNASTPSDHEPSSSQPPTLPPASIQSSTPNPKMARMRFPTFDGDIKDYSRFKGLFMHCTQGMTEMERFYQLTESMVNKTEKNKIKGCINLSRAWEILDEYYGDKDKLVDNLLKELDNLKPYGKTNLLSMNNFVQTLRNFETHAESLGLGGELNSKIMLGQIKLKLPEDHRVGYYESVRDGKTEDSLTGLVNWLHTKLSLLEKAKVSDPNVTNDSRKFSRSVNSAMINHNNKTHVKSGNRNCPLHPGTGSHYLKQCNKFKAMQIDQKFRVMKDNSICFRCGHDNCPGGKRPYDRNSCQYAAPCRTPSCNADSHFTAICPMVYGERGSKSSGQLNSNAESYRPTAGATEIQVSSAVNNGGKLQGVLPTVMGYLRSGAQRWLVRILLDDGSQATFLRKGIFPKTDHDKYQDHNLTLAGGAQIRRKLRLVDCQVEDIAQSWSFPLTMIEIDKPCGDIPTVHPSQLEQYSHLSDVDIEPAPSDTIDVLVGVDNSHLMVWKDYILGERSDDPVAVQCPFGWFIQGGKISLSSKSSKLSNYVNITATGLIEDFIGVERLGLEPKKCNCTTDTLDIKATQAMQESVTRLPDGSYEIQLPWRKPPNELPDNYSYAVKRLKALEKQFATRPEEWEIYCKQMRDQLSRGVARRVTEEELNQDHATGKKMWFLPHFAVVKDSKTTPVRVVYDGKARYQGQSLNDYLVKGENINSDLFEVALRFRENEVGLIADISKMYQAIKIRPEDARFHRYVFRENPNHPIQVFELTTVTFGDKPSPTAAIVTLRHVAAENAPNDERLQRVISEQFYVDDLSESVADDKEALDLKNTLTETLAKGNFNIKKWQSNVKEICDETEDKDTASVLGTGWDLRKDTLKVNVKEVDHGVPTKRNILSQTASYYDIFGMLSGILIRPKILLQKLWQLEVDWDTPLNPHGELFEILRVINQDLKEIADIEIPRCLIPDRFRGRRPLPNVSLHGFSDASEDAMGIGVWLRWSDSEESEADLSFVCARAKLTPLKQTSMPRKELQAILLLSRLMITVKNALRFDISYSKLWTDSMTVISWLRGQSKSFRSYVSHRVGEITAEFDPISDVAYVPTELNIIDMVSRGGTAPEMMKVLAGPEYLKQPQSSWPKTPADIPVASDDEEKKKFHIRNSKTLAVKINSHIEVDPVTDPTRFSSWPRLKNVTARVLSLKNLPRSKWLKCLTTQVSEYPSTKTFREAELYWIREAQRGLDLQDPNIMKLEPFLDQDEQVYRVGGRVSRAPLSYDIRHPYLLPKNSYISMLIVRDRHCHALHGGHLRTAAEVRKNYWIVGDINLARQVVRNCVVCRKYKGKPTVQKMGNLPEFRVTPCTAPFKTTGVDYLGPLNVKLNRNTTAKGYCAVFTCAVTRAVHLTCVQDLSTPAFLQALERFVSIRGAPSLMYSDNGTCFRGANNTINELNLKLDQDQLRSHCQRYDVEWKFGPPGGPHFQGTVERMVQEVKKGMRHLVNANKLSFIEWETILCQISGLINSRPLTAKSSSPFDYQPLTPNHFLIGRGDLPSPSVPCEDYSGNLRKRRELCNTMVDGFWKRWLESLHKLSPRHKWQQASENLISGDIVLVISPDARRGSWKMAEVLHGYPGTDNLVRVVDLKFPDGSKVKRPVTKLILLMKRTERSDVD